MNAPIAGPATSPGLTGLKERTGAAVTLATVVLLALLSSQALQDPMLVSRFGLRSDIANSIARTVEALGYVPWWALVIIGGGVAGIVVRMVIRYGVRYTAAW